MARRLPVPGLRLSWRVAPRRRSMCSGRGGRVSVTSGTIFARIQYSVDGVVRGLLMVLHGQGRDRGAQPTANARLGSHQTARSMLHRSCAVLLRLGRDRLGGMVEVDDAYIGGQESGLPSGRTRDKNVRLQAGAAIHPRRAGVSQGVSQHSVLGAAGQSWGGKHPRG